jgi:hypothetical protein
VIDFLENFRFVALCLVILAIPAAAFFAVGVMMFCDDGHISHCASVAGSILAIPALQGLSLAISWNLFAKRRNLQISAGLMILSSLPSLLLIKRLIFGR